jgi:hypothetical protein
MNIFDDLKHASLSWIGFVSPTDAMAHVINRERGCQAVAIGWVRGEKNLTKMIGPDRYYIYAELRCVEM